MVQSQQIQRLAAKVHTLIKLIHYISIHTRQKIRRNSSGLSLDMGGLIDEKYFHRVRSTNMQTNIKFKFLCYVQSYAQNLSSVASHTFKQTKNTQMSYDYCNEEKNCEQLYVP